MNWDNNMGRCLVAVSIHCEPDIVLAHQRARQIAQILGFSVQDQVRIATAVSELARNAYLYAGRGKVEFRLSESQPRRLQIHVVDHGPGIADLNRILAGQYSSPTGMGIGIVGARRLMDEFEIESAPGKGTSILLGKFLPAPDRAADSPTVTEVVEKLAKQRPQDAFAQVQHQNQELLSTLEQLEKRQAELVQLNKELEDTNRGVVALYAELDERADYLRRASELKTEFLSNMTHEFRTPLNSILSLSGILLDRLDGELTREQEKQVKFIQKAAGELSELVNDMLDLAKVEAGKITVRPTEFEVSGLFGGLRGMLRPLLAHNSSVSLQFEEPGGIPTLHTDESKVSQILRNLISNALKYTERGEVRVRAWLMEPEQEVAFEVSDTGIGIALADQARIFDEFTQIEGPHQTGKKGTGLGLPLSRKLAQLLGGTLEVQSDLGLGSTFMLRVPVAYSGPSEVSAAPELSSELDSSRHPVLIVEDNCETLFIYEKYFKGTGYQPIPARTLQQARQALAHFRPVAVILDILLEHENTWSLLTELNRDAATREIPVLVVTVVENQYKALALGAKAFHAKPIDRSWLLQQLQTLAVKDSGEVLVIDDDEASRYVLRGLLGNTRFRVVEASTGHEGLRLAREGKPAAVFLDLVMPDLSGFQFLELLRAETATRGLPVVVHTGKVLTDQERQLLANYNVGVIPKNHSDRMLSLQWIREALNRVGLVGTT